MFRPTGVSTESATLELSQEEGLRVFKALAHRTRMGILRLLDDGEHTVTELTAQFDLAQPSISRHLAILKKAELVHRRRIGQCVYYRLNAEEVESSLRGFLRNFRQCGGRRSLTAADSERPRTRRHALTARRSNW